MHLDLLRFSSGRYDTLGAMLCNGRWLAYTLEDEARVEKVAGETRIPDGTYQIKQRKQLSPMTKRYRARFGWFRWHLQILDVPGFQWVYIHIGNDEDDTDGCPVVGNTSAANINGRGFVGDSAAAYRRVYQTVTPALERGELVTITVRTVDRANVEG